jgi:hypothetical protein
VKYTGYGGQPPPSWEMLIWSRTQGMALTSRPPTIDPCGIPPLPLPLLGTRFNKSVQPCLALQHDVEEGGGVWGEYQTLIFHTRYSILISTVSCYGTFAKWFFVLFIEILLMFAVDTFIHHRGGFKNKIDAHPFLWFRTRLAPNLVDPIQGLQFWIRIFRSRSW